MPPGITRRPANPFKDELPTSAVSLDAVRHDGGFVSKKLQRVQQRFPSAENIASFCAGFGGLSLLAGYELLQNDIVL